MLSVTKFTRNQSGDYEKRNKSALAILPSASLPLIPLQSPHLSRHLHLLLIHRHIQEDLCHIMHFSAINSSTLTPYTLTRSLRSLRGQPCPWNFHPPGPPLPIAPHH